MPAVTIGTTPESLAFEAGAFQKLSHSTGWPSPDYPVVWAAQSGRADLVEQAIQWSWSSLRVPHLLDDVPISLLEEGRKWMDQPPLAHDLAAFRTCANRQQPIGTPD